MTAPTIDFARRLAALGAGPTYARTLVDAGGPLLTDDLLRRAETARARELHVQGQLDTVATALRTAAQGRGLPIAYVYADAGHRDAHAGSVPLDLLARQLGEDAANWQARHAVEAARVEELRARCEELLDCLRSARERRAVA